MKYLTIILFAFFLSCEEGNDILKDANYYGFANADLNSEEWQTDLIVGTENTFCNNGTYSITVFFTKEYEDSSYPWLHNITITNIPKVTTRINLMDYPEDYESYCDFTETSFSQLFILKSHDVLGDAYSIFTMNNSNYIEITSYDSISGIVEGKFELSFVIDIPDGQTKKISETPDTIRFTNGSFKTKIFDQ